MPWTAIVTVAALVLGAVGYAVSPADQGVLVGALGSIVAGVLQVVEVVKHVKASKEAAPSTMDSSSS